MATQRCGLPLLLLPTLIQAAPSSEAKGWAPIPAEVWAMKEDPAKGIKGAVVLEDRYEIFGDKVIRTYRVRILNDAGREAANLFFFPGETPKVDGRTVYPDGKTVPFEGAKDSNTKTLFHAWWVDAKRTLVIPPGINGDCVFEVRWEEPRLGTFRSRYIQYLGGKFHTLRTVIEIQKDLRRSHEVLFKRDIQAEVADEPTLKRFTLHDLPGKEEVPYSLRVTQGLPRIVVFDRSSTRSLAKQMTTETDSVKKADLYWKAAAEQGFKSEIESRQRTGSAFEAMTAELLAGLPASPHARAAMLLTRLNQRIRNRDYPTFTESAAEKRIHDRTAVLDYLSDFNPTAFENHAERHIATGDGMWRMYYALLDAAGMHPLVGLVADRDLVLFNYQTLDLNQITHMLIGIEEPGKGTLWLDPGLRFAPPGLILPVYQGTPGLILDIKDWSVRSYQVPVQPAGLNRSRFEYRLKLEEDSEAFSVDADLMGYPEYEARLRYTTHDPERRGHMLKEELEQANKGLVVSKSEVLNTEDPTQGFGWKAEGHLDIEPGGALEVQPFPAMPWPLWVPDKLSETRAEPILIPFRKMHGAISRFTVPAGYRFKGIAPESFSNRFGSVKWSATAAAKGSETEVTVVYEVAVEGFYEKPEAYEDLKTFLGWIRQTCRRTLLLEKA